MKPDIPSPSVPGFDPFSKARIGGLDLKNRIIKAATFEGMTPNGMPGADLKGFHLDIAKGGVAMTTIAYCATEADGRIMDHMMYLHEGVEKPLVEMIKSLHKAGCKVSGQLTHCGGFSRNKNLLRLKRPLGPSPRLSLMGLMGRQALTGEMSQVDIDYFIDTYAQAAALMKRTGFDAIEIHFGHGYGLSQFISPKTNKRKDGYGGSLDNRMRLPLQVLAAVRMAVGQAFPILGKMSLSDGVRGGLRWQEGVRVAQMLDEAGIDALVPSDGTSSFNVMRMFRGDSIMDGVIAREPNRLKRSLLKLLSPLMFKRYHYHELYLLEQARAVKAVVECAVVYIGGCSSRQSLERIFAAGLDFVQIGRGLIKDRDFVRHAQAKADYESGCTHCNHCVALIDAPGGIRCVLNAKKV